MPENSYNTLPATLHEAEKLLRRYKPSASIFVNMPGEEQGVVQIRQYGVVYRYKEQPLAAAQQFIMVVGKKKS